MRYYNAMNRPSSSPFAVEQPARFSVAEFLSMAPSLRDIPGKIELVDGVITRMSPANYPHFVYQRQLFLKLHQIFGSGIDGFIVGQELTVRLGVQTVRDPDVAIFRDPGPIDTIVDQNSLLLAVEVADSSLRDDLGAKLRTYAEASVPEYWVVDINGRIIHRFSEPANGAYRIEQRIEFGDPLPVPGSEAAITID